MEMFDNLNTVQQLFKFYGDQNIAGFMSLLNPDAVWIEPGGDEIPYSGTFKGLAEIGRMIGIVAKNQKMIAFKVTDYCVGDNLVTALGYNEAEVFSTGKCYTTEWVYAFSFTNGKISQVKVYMDTLTMAKANTNS